AEEHQGPVALQLARHQRRAVGLLQAEGGQLAWLLEQLHRLQRRSRRAGGRREPGLGGPKAETGGQRGDQGEEGGTVEHAGAFFSRYLNFGHDSRAPVIIRGPAPPANSGPAMTDELQTIVDLTRYGASRFNAAGLTIGHSYDNALDEATQLTLHALHLPHDIGPAYGQARVTLAEKEEVLALFLRRIEERVPAAYLTGEAWFAGLSFKSDPRALVPRSPIAELIEAGFEPWLGGREVRRALDLCTGSGCIAIAMAHYNPD